MDISSEKTQNTSTAPVHQAAITLTQAAALRVVELLEGEKDKDLKLRVYITGGGCSGFQYGFGFDKSAKPDDCIIETSVLVENTPFTVYVIVDPLSLMYLEGAQVDYVENLQGAHFVVKNPNAQTTCSCGSSFAL